MRMDLRFRDDELALAVRLHFWFQDGKFARVVDMNLRFRDDELSSRKFVVAT